MSVTDAIRDAYLSLSLPPTNENPGIDELMPIDAALQHLIESAENIKDARDDPDISPEQIQAFNTPVLKLHCRMPVDSPWRR